MKLYYAPNTCALASHIVLEEVGAQYEAVRISFAANEHLRAAYAAINPKARVPSLTTDRGVLTETPAILTFIAQSYPDAGLVPTDDAFAFAELQAFNAYLCSTVHVAHAHRMRGTRWVDDPAALEAMRRNVPHTVGACFDLIERSMFQGPFVMGERYTICDPYLFTLAQWWEVDGVDPGRCPQLAEHRRRIAERSAVKRAITLQMS